MTTIVFRDGELAADRRMNANGVCCGEFTKIARSPGGAIGGAAGSVKSVNRFLDWITAGAEGAPPVLPRREEGEGYVIFPNSRVFSWDGDARLTEVFGPFFATGSGWEIALGALAMGADARRAVQIASQFDANTGGAIDVLTIRERD